MHRQNVHTNIAFTFDGSVVGLFQDNKMNPPPRVDVREFRGNLAGFLRQVRLDASFLVRSCDHVLVEVRPPPKIE